MVILYGAGENARKILRSRIGETVKYLIDIDPKKIDTSIMGKKIYSIEKLNENKNIPVVVTPTNISKDFCEKIRESKDIEWFREIYANKLEIRKRIDKSLMEQRQYENMVHYCYKEKMDNWYREEFISETNRMLIMAMKNNDEDKILKIMDSMQPDGKFYKDELFINRPGMRLAMNIIIDEQLEFKGKLLDIGCAHGEFIKELNKHFKCKSCGIDSDRNRLKYLVNEDIDARFGFVEAIPYDDNEFDYVSCFECLEHVNNVVCAVSEIHRILKKGGKCFVTVPWGKFCDCEEHVRHFDENRLFSIFSMVGFKVETIMRIPYLNYSINDSIFLEAIK